MNMKEKVILIAVLAIIVLLLVVWAIIERQILLMKKKQIIIHDFPEEYNGLRIMHISDLHHRQMGKDNTRIILRIQRNRPDFVVITGDLVSRDMQDFTSTESFLRQVRRICPVFLCLGTHEMDLPKEFRQDLEDSIRRAGCCLLMDDIVRLFPNKYKEAPLYLAGANLRYNVYRNEKNGYWKLADYTGEDLEQALGKRPGTTILLVHNPLFLKSYAAWGADLVLCGHMHGGVIRLPLIGGILSPERKFFPKYDKGWYQCGKTQMHVSGGIGKPRLFNPPEITNLEIVNQ